jgi:hypothetical protein
MRCWPSWASVRRSTADIYTVAGSGSTSADSYTSPVLSTGVSMSPQKLAIDNAGNLYISDGNGFIWFLDFHTGYLRAVRGMSQRYAPVAILITTGDGCPATQAKFGDGGNGIGVGADALGNIYISDTTNGLIRKVITGLAIAFDRNWLHQRHSWSNFTSSLAILQPRLTRSLITQPSGHWEHPHAPPTLTTRPTACLLPALHRQFQARAPHRSPSTVPSATQPTWLSLESDSAPGSTLDPASQLSFGANIQVAGIATDTAGNVYVSDGTSKTSASALLPRLRGKVQAPLPLHWPRSPRQAQSRSILAASSMSLTPLLV